MELVENETLVKINPDQCQLTRLDTRRAVDSISRTRDRPFFLYLPYNKPQTPLFVSDRSDAALIIPLRAADGSSLLHAEAYYTLNLLPDE